MSKSVNEWELQSVFWTHFDRKRTREMGGDIRRFTEGFISLAVPAGSSLREDIEEIARGAIDPLRLFAYRKDWNIGFLVDERISARLVVRSTRF